GGEGGEPTGDDEAAAIEHGSPVRYLRRSFSAKRAYQKTRGDSRPRLSGRAAARLGACLKAGVRSQPAELRSAGQPRAAVPTCLSQRKPATLQYPHPLIRQQR